MQLVLVERRTEIRYVEDYGDSSKVMKQSGSFIELIRVDEPSEGSIFDAAATHNACLSMSMADADDSGYTSYEFVCAYDEETKEDLTELVRNGKVDESRL